MDRDWGAKAGGGGVASGTNANVDRRERLRQLALETIDITKVLAFPALNSFNITQNTLLFLFTRLFHQYI